jgi:nucleotide-binding universal stress UspA family protein
MKVRRILVPLDGSPTAEAALRPAHELARTAGAELLLIRVTEARFDPSPAPMAGGLSRIREAEGYLATIRERLRAGGEQISAFLWHGSPAAAIIKAANGYQADMIVMTTHGRSGREKEMFGSVAEAVLRGTNLPVLVVRPEGLPVQPPPGQATPTSGLR